jgi:glycosyltransferase involved in cell wall biosynthesis
MRIALFHNLPSGGAKRAAFEFVKHLSKSHEIDLYIYDIKAEDFWDLRRIVKNTFIVNGGETSGETGLRRIISINRVRTASKKTARLINDGKYDVALVMQCKVTNSPYVLCYLDIPSLYFCHESTAKIMEPHYRGQAQDGRLASLKIWVLKWFIEIDRANAIGATLICTSSLYSRENLYRNYGVYPRLNYLGVDTDFFRPLNLHREPTVLCVGALNSAKGQDFLIKSVGTLTQRPHVKLIYNFSYGLLTYKSNLIKLAEKLDVSLSFECMVDDESLVKAYNQATLTVFPSLLEPLGLVPLESMSCGTPVVGIAEAGVRETVIHNDTGLLTERDPQEFGRAIDQLMNDKVIWKKMSVKGRQWVQKSWSWEQASQQLEKNMQKAIERYAGLCMQK